MSLAGHSPARSCPPYSWYHSRSSLRARSWRESKEEKARSRALEPCGAVKQSYLMKGWLMKCCNGKEEKARSRDLEPCGAANQSF